MKAARVLVTSSDAPLGPLQGTIISCVVRYLSSPSVLWRTVRKRHGLIKRNFLIARDNSFC